MAQYGEADAIYGQVAAHHYKIQQD